MLKYDRSMTPLSLNDSGVEEQEDTAMVPAETLCELLRRAFRLSHDKFNQYEEIIAAQLEKKSPQKVNLISSQWLFKILIVNIFTNTPKLKC